MLRVVVVTAAEKEVL